MIVTSDSILREANQRKVRDLFQLLLSSAQGRLGMSSNCSMDISNTSRMREGADMTIDVCGSVGDSVSPTHGLGRIMGQNVSAMTSPQRDAGRDRESMVTPDRSMRSFLNTAGIQGTMQVSADASLGYNSSLQFPLERSRMMHLKYHQDLDVVLLSSLLFCAHCITWRYL